MPTGARAAVATGEVVFNTVLSRLPGGHHRPLLRRPGHRLHLPPHRQLRGQRPTTTRRPGPSAGGWSCATWPTGPATGGRPRALEDFLVPPRGARHHRRRHPAPDPAPARPRGHALRLRHRPPRRELAAAAAAAARHRRPRPGLRGDHRRPPYPCGTGPLRVVAYDFGIKETMLRQLGDLATVTVVPASTPADEVLALEPDGVFLSNGPGDPAALAGDRRRRVAEPGSAGSRSSASASATSCWPPPSGPPPTSSPSATTAATTRCAGWPTARSRSPARTTTTRWPRARSTAADVTHVNLNDGVVEGLRSRDAPAFSVQYHPEAGPGPHDARYLFERVPGADGGDRRPTARTCLMPRRDRHRVDPGHRLGPDRHRPGLRVRLLGHPGLPGAARGGVTGWSWPTPTRPRS